MYNGGPPGGAINTGIPAAVVAVSAAGLGGQAVGAAIATLAAVNLALLWRARRLKSRTFPTDHRYDPAHI